MSILLKNVKTVDCHTERSCDVFIEDGVIAQLGDGLIKQADRIIDGEGLTLLPSFVDLHAHFRDPGQTQKEDIVSGCLAAVHGGYTAVNLMPNTNPVCSSMEIVNYVQNKAKELDICDVYQTVSITKNFDGKTMSHLGDIDDSVLWITDDGNGLDSTEVMLAAMTIGARRGFGLMLHEEHRILTPLNSYLAEDLHTYRDCELAVMTGCKVHFCHVSTKDSIDFIHHAKQRGANVSCEVTPHHLYLTDRNGGRVAPPLRGEAHRLALIEAIKHGQVDAIATDHAPHTPADKEKGMNGFSGIDLSFATCYTVLVKENGLPLTTLSQLMSQNPAGLMGYSAGLIEENAPADVVLVDLNKSFVVSEEQIHSRSKNTPMLGETLYGEILMTLKKGRIVYEKGID